MAGRSTNCLSAEVLAKAEAKVALADGLQMS